MNNSGNTLKSKQTQWTLATQWTTMFILWLFINKLNESQWHSEHLRPTTTW